MGYIVWHDFGTEGWFPSSDTVSLQSLDDVWDYLQKNPHRGQPFLVTRKVNVRLVDDEAALPVPMEVGRVNSKMTGDKVQIWIDYRDDGWKFDPDDTVLVMPKEVRW